MWSKSIRTLNPYEATKESSVQRNAQVAGETPYVRSNTQCKNGSR